MFIGFSLFLSAFNGQDEERREERRESPGMEMQSSAVRFYWDAPLHYSTSKVEYYDLYVLKD